MGIDSSTRLCCLIGHPIGHSVSPQMHNAAFRRLNLNYVYLAFDVRAEELGDAVKGLKAIRVKGFNVTIPHKIEIMKFLDGLDKSAELVGAVNTVVLEERGLIGYNTDFYGIKRVLRGRARKGRAMIIGAGGAGRAAAAALIDLGFSKLIIANRTLKRAEALAERLGKFGIKAEAVSLDEAHRYAVECSVIVNTTPLGMAPDLVSKSPLSRGEISRNSVILDLVYNPVKTKLLGEAEAAGAHGIPGIEVLVAQGAEAFKLWTGIDPPTEIMYEAALRALGKVTSP